MSWLEKVLNKIADFFTTVFGSKGCQPDLVKRNRLEDDPLAHLTNHDQWVLNKWYRECVTSKRTVLGKSEDLFFSFNEYVITLFCDKKAGPAEIIVTQKDIEIFLTQNFHRSQMIEGSLWFYDRSTSLMSSTFTWSGSETLRT